MGMPVSRAQYFDGGEEDSSDKPLDPSVVAFSIILGVMAGGLAFSLTFCFFQWVRNGCPRPVASGSSVNESNGRHS